MEALVNVDSSLICARIIQVFVGAFFYIFMIAKAVGSENKAKWFKRRMSYTFFNRRGIFGEYINFGYPVTWQGAIVFLAIYGVIFGFGYWYVFIHAYN
ncbi:MAG: hypothetical protein EP149_05770 [Phascolarctobacterium sp.]|nr:hypothetical protein [Phascolarctobacterium sp.]MUU07201.1 hypothetical protein [Phascolarctobacterium sp.]MUU16842.1 hypothetical protein [Phascolarctobacterium sp.]